MNKGFARFLILLVVLFAVSMVPAVFAQSEDEEVEYEDFSFAGLIEEITDTTVTISSLVFNIETAEIEDELVIGAYAEVEFYVEDGTLVALEIGAELEDDEDADEEDAEEIDEEDAEEGEEGEESDYEDFSFAGLIEAVTESTVTVSGLTFNTETAEIEGELVEGAYAEVEFYVEDAVLIALEIEASDEDDADEDEDDADDEECVVEDIEEWTAYTIQPGDTLFNIALASGTDFEDLLEVNCIEDPNLISVGTVIYVEFEPDFDEEEAEEIELEEMDDESESDDEYEYDGDDEDEDEEEDEDEYETEEEECEYDDGKWVCEREGDDD